MRTLQSFLAMICVVSLLAPAARAEQPNGAQPWYGSGPGGFWSRISQPYKAREVAPVKMENSGRLESLLRAGNLYLSLQDTIALALENNLDIELQRYGPRLAQVDLMRAEAGGLLRGVPTTVQAGPSSAQSQAIGGVTGGGGRAGGGGGAETAGVGGTVITQTGAAIPNLDPVMFTSYGWGHRTRPQSNTITTGLTALTFNSTDLSYGIQKGFLSGTTVSFGWNNTSFQSNNPLSDLNPAASGNFQFQVSQKLLQGFGVAVNNRNIRIARNDLRISDLVFKQQVIVTTSAIVNLYWDLVSFIEDVKVKRQALLLAEKLYNDNKKQVEIGTLAPIEIVSAEAQVARRQQELIFSETSVRQQETILKSALSRNGVASPALSEASVIPTDVIRVPERESVRPVQDVIDMALKNRPELEQTQINIDNAKIGLQGSRSQLLPSLEVQMNLQNSGLAGEVNSVRLRGQNIPRQVDQFFVGGSGTVLSQIFRRNFPDYAVAFQLNVPLRNRSAQADMVRDQLTLRQAELRQQQQLNQVRVDVQNALIALQQARARHQAAVKERMLQEQTLEAEQKKYALGASTVFFVIQYQRDLAQAQSAEVGALSAYAKAQVDLDRITGNTLAANNIQIDEALHGSVSRPPGALPAAKP